MLPCRMSCRCRDFQARPDGACYCTHPRSGHGLVSVEIPARGQNPETDCLSFSRDSAFEGQDFEVNQLCICGTSWLEHTAPSGPFTSLPMQVATQAPVTPWLPSQRSSAIMPGSHASLNPPSSSSVTLGRMANNTASWRPSTSSTSMSPGFSQVTPSPGIPSGIFPSLFSQASNPSRRLNTQRGSLRHRPYGSPQFSSTNSSVGPRQFTLAFVPYAPGSTLNVDSADNPDLRLFRDTIHNFFERLETRDLLRTITLQPTNIREQLHTHICNLMVDNNLSIPNRTISQSLAANEEAFWDILQGGNRTRQGQLIKPADILPSDLANFTKLDQITPKLRSPLGALPVIIVSAKSRVNGPIIPGSSEGHACYASRVFWGLFAPPLDGADDPSPHCFPDQCPISGHLSSAASVPSTPASSTSTLPSPARSFSALPYSNSASVSSSMASTSTTTLQDLSIPTRGFSIQVSRSSPFESNYPSVLPQLPPRASSPSPATNNLSVRSSLFESNYPLVLPQLPPRAPSPSPATNRPIGDLRQLRPRQTTRRESIVAAPPTSNANEISSLDVRQWFQQLQRLLGDSPRQGLSISVGPPHSDPETIAAQTFIDVLLAYHLEGSLPEPSTFIDFFCYEDLAIGEKRVYLGASVGDGPIRAMYERTLLLLTKDPSVWKPSRNGTFTWNVRAIPTNSVRLAKARTAGTLLALGFTWFARSFHPISFWLSALCVAPSFEDLKCINYIGQIDEELGNSLGAWPLDPSIPLITSPSLTTLLTTYLNTTYLEVQNCGPEERLYYRDELLAQALFQTSAGSIQSDPELNAMREAFNITLTSNVRLREMFGISPLNLLSKMYGQLLHSVETLIQHLEFQPLSLQSPFTEDDLDIYHMKLARYLRGVGHPSNIAEDILPSAMREEMANDKLYRARRFLKCSTGLSTVPTNADWKIMITLMDEVPGEYQFRQPTNAGVNWQPEVPAFIFHTCAQDVHVCYSSTLKEYLQMVDPENDMDPTPFDAWVHQHLIETRDGDGWNVL